MTTGVSSTNRENRQTTHVLRLFADIRTAAALIAMLASVYAVDSVTRTVVEKPPDALPPVQEVAEPEPPPPPPMIELPEEVLPPIDPTRRILVKYRPDLRFGVSTTSGNPEDPNDDHKKLTYADDGSTSNTRVWVDGETPMFGGSAGRITRRVTEIGDRLECEWEYRGIRVTRRIEYLASNESRRVDSVRVEYELTNVGTTSRQVGLRVMIDSLIGHNDGVPFIVPGREQIVTSPQSFRTGSIPDFVRALEIPNLVNPGVIADLRLRLKNYEEPSEVILTHWPGSNADWNYDRNRSFGDDMAIGVYHDAKPLRPGESRTAGFSYGLGTISSTRSRNANLGLTAGGPFRSGGKFWMVALVQNPRAGQSVRLELPEGIKPNDQHPSSKEVPTGNDYTEL